MQWMRELLASQVRFGTLRHRDVDGEPIAVLVAHDAALGFVRGALAWVPAGNS